MPVVRKVMKELALDESLDHDYQNVLGFERFVDEAIKLAFGAPHCVVAEKRVTGVQTVGGTSAIRLGSELLTRVLGVRTIYCPQPTWNGHLNVTRHGGFTDIRRYTWWDEKTRSFACDHMLAELAEAPEGSVIVLHGCGHNTVLSTAPHGYESKRRRMEENRIPHEDAAYAGFVTGDPIRDTWAVQYFANMGLEMLVAQRTNRMSSSGDVRRRLCCQHAVSAWADFVVPLGQRAVTWGKDCSQNTVYGIFTCRVGVTTSNNVRTGTRHEGKASLVPGQWDHLTRSKGMFWYSEMNARHAEFLVKKYHVYMLSDGRINVCGLTTKNLPYVATAIHDAVLSVT